MAIDQSWLDGLLSGYNQILINGTPLPQRPILNLIGPTGVDNPSNGQTNVTVSGGGGSTFGQNNITLVNGLNSNVATAGQQTLRIGGPTGPYWIGGLLAPTSGAFSTIDIIDTTGQLMGVLNQDASSAAANRIAIAGYAAGQIIFAQHRPGTKLQLKYDTFSGLWNLTDNGYQSLDLCSVSVCDFGAVGDGVTNDTAAIQSAVNFVCNDTSFKLVFPANKSFLITQPINIWNGNVLIEGEIPNTIARSSPGSTSIYQYDYLGDCFNVTPQATPAPAVVETSNFWCANFQAISAGQPAIYLTEYECGNINGFTAFTFYCVINQTATPNNYSFIAGSSGTDGQKSAMAFALYFDNTGAGRLGVSLTTSGSGLVNFYSTENITGSALSKLSVTYDGSEVRLFINGSPAGSIAATGAIVQANFEDFTIGAGNIPAYNTQPYGQYPFASFPIGQATQVTGIANPCIWKSAYYLGGTSAGYTAPTVEVEVGSNNTLTMSFAPLGTTIPGVGLTSNPAQIVALGFTSAIGTWGPLEYGLPIYFNWSGTYATQSCAGVIIRGLVFKANLSLSAIRANLAPSIHVEWCGFGGSGRAVTLVNNCYTSLVRDCYSNLAPVGSAQSWGWCSAGQGSNQVTVDNFNVFCGAYGLVFSGSAGLARNCYLVAAGGGGSQAGVLVHQAGGQFHFDGVTVSDEGGAYNKSAIILDSASPVQQFSTITFTSCGAGISNTSAPALAINNYGTKLTVTCKGSQFGSAGSDQLIVNNANNLKLLFDDLANAMTFSAAMSVPTFKIDSYEVQTDTLNFASNAPMTVAQDDWLHAILAFTDTHPYLTGTQTVNMPFLFSGKTAYLYNSTAQTLTFKWAGGTGATGLNLAAGYGMHVRSDGTNLFQTTAAISPG